MPLSNYFKGKGESVMDDMTDRYGEKKGKSVFYATANKKGMAPSKKAKGKGKKKGKRPPFMNAKDQAAALRGKE